ncbi:ABA4-like family protein [Luedemannella flava]|uniref:ABA4-like family protein n=1 Tax=Luedemannella flava TaxID=349316 RepID=A0ABN2LDG0_9ACTN
MTWEQLFALTALPVAPLWFLMIVAPTWSWTRRIVASPWSFVPLALVYAVLVVPRLGDILPVVTRPELAEVGALLATPAGATIAWVHFLVFDAFTGRWIYLDSRDRKLQPLLMAPILVLVILLGPLGFLIYLLARLAGGNRESSESGQQRDS